MRPLLHSLAIILLLVVSLSCGKKDDPKPAVTPPTPPMAVFTFQAGDYGNVLFANGSTDATSYSWSFGDGIMSDKESPDHVFGTANSFIVTLTATGEGGATSISKTVTVVKSIVGIFTGRSWQVYNCDDVSNNHALTSCPVAGCTEYEFTSTSLIIRNQGVPAATHTYTIVGNELKLVPGYTETFLLSNFTGPELTITNVSTPGSSGANCRLDTNFDR